MFTISQSSYRGTAGALRKILHECKIGTGSTHTDNYGVKRRFKFVISSTEKPARVKKAIATIKEQLGGLCIEAKEHRWAMRDDLNEVYGHRRGIVVVMR